MGRRYGFIPYQHVFGGDFRLPGLLTEGENTSHLHQSGASVVHAADSFWTRQKMRMAARKAMVEADEKDKVIRAVEHRSRPSKDFQVGQLVYYWRRFPKDDKKGAWRGPARVIGYFDSSKIWVCHDNKVWRCAPEQVRALTTDQEAAVKFVPIELQSQAGRFAKRGAQTFIDVSNQGKPPNEEGAEITNAESRTKRRKTQARDAEDDEMEDDQNMLEEEGQSVLDEGAIDEETTTDNGGLDRMVSEAPTMGQENVPGPMPEYDIAGNAYGPIRRRDDHQREDPLTTALRRSTELLDLGQSRTRRAADDETADVLEVTIFDSDETGDERHFETFMVSVADRKNAELQNSDLTEEEKMSLDAGKQKELSKLLNTRSIKVYSGEDARRIYDTVDSKRILESRFVKTRRDNPDTSQSEIKCRWVVKGFQDPDLDELERQSPTLSADGLGVALQTIASNKWQMTIADVEGAFLQGDEYSSKGGSIFPAGSIFELTKCVYGLMDAPLRWWRSITGILKSLGAKQSELDPCIFYWFHEHVCQGIFAIHVDDILFGGTEVFENIVLKGLKQRYPFKHWKRGSADFLGHKLI